MNRADESKDSSEAKPDFIYGTAWKEEATSELVKLALANGFKALDTANQKKHYREDYAGDALAELFAQGLDRSSIWLQSKFTYVQGQDSRLPYDPDDTFTNQVLDSFANSLENLHTDYLDSYLLHGPLNSFEMLDGDWEVWRALEDLYDSGKTLAIGLSNIGPSHLMQVLDNGKVKPAYVQNRCFASTGWDREVRQICNECNIGYQAFSLLTANRAVLMEPSIENLAHKYHLSPQQLIFKFAIQIGMIPLTGTSQSRHMKADLELGNEELSPSEMNLIEGIAE